MTSMSLAGFEIRKNLCTVIILPLSILMIRSSLATMTLHFKCRGGVYPRSNIERYAVPDDKVSWCSEYKEYKPLNHTASSIRGQPWADPNIGKYCELNKPEILTFFIIVLKMLLIQVNLALGRFGTVSMEKLTELVIWANM